MTENMSIFDAFARRRSVRVFKKQKIAPDTMDKLLRAIQSAPSAGNLQAYQLYLAEKPAVIQALARAALNQTCVANAPAVLVFCADPRRSMTEYGERGRDLYCLQDATIAASFAHLAAVALELGSVMVGAFKESEVIEAIGAPYGQIPVLMLSIGYPDEHPAPTGRRNLDDFVARI